MLTVKHIRFDGAETLDSAERVIFYPSDAADMRQTPTPHAGGSVTLVGAIGGISDWHSGNIYVTNEYGATVACYDLGASERQDGQLKAA